MMLQITHVLEKHILDNKFSLGRTFLLLLTLYTVVEMIRIYVFDKLGFYKITKKIYTKYQKTIIILLIINKFLNEKTLIDTI